MIICHLNEFEKYADFDFIEFMEKHKRDTIQIIYDDRRMVITDDGNEHIFMGGKRYREWCKGRTYMLNGVLMHSGYPFKKEG